MTPFGRILLFAVTASLAAAQITAVSSASYQTPVAPASLVTLFGSNPATSTAQAQLDANGQLPTELAGIAVRVAGQTAQLLYVSPGQINMVMPAAIASGIAEIEVRATDSSQVQRTTVEVSNAAPALFSLDASGRGGGSILNAVTFTGGPFTIESLANLGDDKRTRLAIYGTGIRYAGNPFLDPSVTNAAGAITARALDSAGNVHSLPVEYAGAAPVYFGLDQVNVVLPPQLDGLGSLSLSISTATASSNVVTFTVGALPADAIRLIGLRLSQSSILSGGTGTGTVTLNAPARTDGFPVSLDSSTNFVRTPATVTVPVGQVEADFDLLATNNGSGPATLTASANGIALTALLVANSANGPALASIALSAPSVVGGTSVTGTVTLTAAAGSAGAVLNLTSDSTSVQPPSTVTIPVGQKSATFTITTSGVQSAVTANLTATYNGVSQSAALTVNPLFTFALESDSVTGGQATTGTVTLGSAAPSSGATVNFASSDPLAAIVTPLAFVAAGQTSATVPITTTPVPTAHTVTITATYKSVALRASLTVEPAGTPVISTIALTPTTVKGGNTVTCMVTLTLPALQPLGTTVVLSSSNRLVVPVPSSVTVPAGQSSFSFVIRTTAVSSPQAVVISGSTGGLTRTATLSVQ